MDLTRQKIKDWLKEIGKNRYWLAEQCNVSKKTVDSWLSSNQPVSPKVIKIIEGLMVQHGQEQTNKPRISYDDIISFTVRMTEDEWNELLKGVPVGNQKEAEEYVRNLLQQVVDETEVDIMSAKYDDPPSEEP
ncbi:hypothetical protein ICN84_06945 [Akkermansia glycaniphila]|uniref:hypothetical protein n=1 Tax=Akkermansia glycaniphila TaxID=1679444 RepID=UPI001C00AB7B|nr:hypothetical protein [Akkermansia glycaniphila]MBT9449812.1 hypothetical protein [Akkermansia glycaniphila]